MILDRTARNGFLALAAALALLSHGGPSLAFTEADVERVRAGGGCPGCNLRQSNFAGADLSGRNLSAADLGGANLEKAKLAGADLSDAKLGDTVLTGADLTGANLKGAKLDGAYLIGTNFSNAIWPDGSVCKPGSSGRCDK